MFWVFCNSCFVKPDQTNKRNFYMTSCSHIFCDRCIHPGDSVCKRCQTSCAIVQCNSEMPEQAKEVFSDTNDNPTQLIRALEFQEFHRKRFMMHYKLLVQKYNHCKMAVNDLQRNLNAMEQKYQTMKQTLQSREELITVLQRKLQGYQPKPVLSSTPRGTPPGTPRGRTSLLNFPMHSTQKMMHLQPIPQKFTPKSNFTNYRKTNTPGLTPKSVASNQSSVASSGFSTPQTGVTSSGEKRRLIPGFTPPTNPLALLSLLNNRARNA